MVYRLVITDEARKQIEKLDKVIKKRIAKKLPVFMGNPLDFAKPLVNFDAGQYRFRVGDYRIIFDIHDDRLEILKVMHRREVYK
jgi:mRNA interferase RelE/StbE